MRETESRTYGFIFYNSKKSQPPQLNDFPALKSLIHNTQPDANLLRPLEGSHEKKGTATYGETKAGTQKATNPGPGTHMSIRK